jgi:hypothetical protein
LEQLVERESLLEMRKEIPPDDGGVRAEAEKGGGIGDEERSLELAHLQRLFDAHPQMQESYEDAVTNNDSEVFNQYHEAGLQHISKASTSLLQAAEAKGKVGAREEVRMQEKKKEEEGITPKKKTIVLVSCPEAGRDTSGELGFPSMKSCFALAKRENSVLVACDWFGSSSLNAEDAPLWKAFGKAASLEEKAVIVKRTRWFAAYSAQVKGITRSACQEGGYVVMACIEGGPITQIEASAMPLIRDQIIADLAHMSLTDVSIEIKCFATYQEFENFVTVGDHYASAATAASIMADEEEVEAKVKEEAKQEEVAEEEEEEEEEEEQQQEEQEQEQQDAERVASRHELWPILDAMELAVTAVSLIPLPSVIIVCTAAKYLISASKDAVQSESAVLAITREVLDAIEYCSNLKELIVNMPDGNAKDTIDKNMRELGELVEEVATQVEQFKKNKGWLLKIKRRVAGLKKLAAQIQNTVRNLMNQVQIVAATALVQQAHQDGQAKEEEAEEPTIATVVRTPDGTDHDLGQLLTADFPLEKESAHIVDVDGQHMSSGSVGSGASDSHGRGDSGGLTAAAVLLEMEVQRVSEQGDTSTKYGLTKDEQRDTVLTKYRLTQDVKIKLREVPDITSPETGTELQCGDTFTVDKVEVEETQNFLHLATGGWAFEFHPTKGTRLCEAINESQIIAEVNKNGTEEQLAIVEYILDQPAKEEEESVNDGHNTVVRNKGHAARYNFHGY